MNLFDVKLTKRFVSGTLEGIQLTDDLHSCTLAQVQSWRMAMLERQTIHPCLGTSAYQVVDVCFRKTERAHG